MATDVQTTEEASGRSEEPPLVKPPRRVHGIVMLASGAILAIFVLLLLEREQLEPLIVAGSILGVAGLLWSTGWWRNLKIVTAVVFDLLLIFAYTWSLGESLHVVVHGSRILYYATIDGNPSVQFSRALRDNPSGQGPDRIGLYAGADSDYVVTAFGTSSTPAANTPFGWLDNSLRFISPKPAWANIHLVAGPARHPIPTSRVVNVRGNFGSNPRGELEGSLGASAYLANLTSRQFIVSADLMRPDGTQGLLFGVGSRRYGYLLAIRMDHRDARWYYWNHGMEGACTCHRVATFSVHTEAMLQRTLRFLLPSIILGILLCLASIPFYLGLLRLLLPFRKRWENLDPLGRWRDKIGSRVADALAVGFTLSTIIVAAGVALRVDRALPTIEDTVTYLFQARTLALGRLWVPIPHHLAFFARPFVIAENGHWFGKYPPGWPMLMSIGAVFGKAWIINPIVTGLGLLVMYLIGRDMHSRPVALTAIALAATSPFVLQQGASYLSHPATWLFLGLFIYLLVIFDKRHKLVSRFTFRLTRSDALLLIGAGAALGMACMTREFDAAVFSLPFFFLLIRRPLAFLYVFLGFLVPTTLLLAYNKDVTGSFLSNAYVQAQPWDRLGFGTNIGGPDAYGAGFSLSRGIWNVAYNLEHLQPTLLGWPFFVALALAAIPFVLGRANHWDWLLLASSLCVVGGYAFYWASGVSGGFPRYWYIFAPWLFLLIARGLQELCRWPVRASHRPQMSMAAFVAPAVLVAMLVAFNLDTFLPQTVMDWSNPYARVVDEIKSRNIHHAVIFQVQPSIPSSQIYAGVFNENPPLLNGDIVWAKDRGRHDIRLMHQYPGRSYYRLDGATLTRLRP